MLNVQLYLQQFPLLVVAVVAGGGGGPPSSSPPGVVGVGAVLCLVPFPALLLPSHPLPSIFCM